MITKIKHKFTLYKIKIRDGKQELNYCKSMDEYEDKPNHICKPALAVWYDDVPNPDVPRIIDDPDKIKEILSSKDKS
jgi:hypothetical protein